MTPSIPLFILILCIPSLSVVRAAPSSSWLRGLGFQLTSSSSRNVPPEGFVNPLTAGGSFLTVVPGTFPAGLGEPLNAILSGNSDAAVLVDQQNDGGMRNYFQSLGFGSTCLGQAEELLQGANLGDGDGVVNQTSVLRWDYGDPTLGTCKETVEGGNHFRYWIQDGKDGNSGAIFMAVSYELPIAQGHDIIDNGYNLGRDWLVGNATSNSVVDTPKLTNASTFEGTSSAGGFTYQTNVTYLSGLLPNTSDGINHFATVGDGQNAVDGLVALFTVTIVTQPTRTMASYALRSITTPTAVSSLLLPFIAYFLVSL